MSGNNRLILHLRFGNKREQLNSMLLWLANCYFTHDSSGFPVLLPLFDAPSKSTAPCSHPKRLRKPGPKGPSAELIHAVVEMKQRNPNWGCPRIAQQIALAFNIQIDKDVLRRILAHHCLPDRTPVVPPG